MSINNPSVLWFILLLIPLVIYLVAQYSKKRDAFKQLAGEWRFPELSHVFLVKTFFSTLFFLLFIIFMLLALADIRWGEKLVEENRSGKEIMIAIDISRSMLAQDHYPSRLEKAKEELKKMIMALSKDTSKDIRFGIVIFKGDAHCILPLTEDLNAINMLIENLNPNLMTTAGSNIERALELALKCFKGKGKFKTIFLYSDGEALSGQAERVAKLAGKQDIPIIPISVGTSEGTEIILQKGKKVLDEHNKPVLTKLNKNHLNEIAEWSGGRVFSLNENSRVIPALGQIWRKLEPGEWQENIRLVKAEMYPSLLMIGLFFMILSLLIKSIKWKKLI
jgi:Ca-activated chloride channel family protein